MNILPKTKLCGTQKITVDLALSFIIALFFHFLFLNKHIHGSLEWTEYAGGIFGSSLTIFFIFFFWTFQKKDVAQTTARVLIKTLLVIFVIMNTTYITLTLIYNPLLDGILSLILTGGLLTLVALKFRKLFWNKPK